MNKLLSSRATLGGLPVTVSGIVFWGMVLVGLFAIIVISNDQERRLQERIHANSLILATEIEHWIERSKHEPQQVLNSEGMKKDIGVQLDALGFRAVNIQYGGQSIPIGEPGNDTDFIERQVILYQLKDENSENVVFLKIYFANVNDTITQIRNELFVSIGVAVFVFGFVLQQILQRVLSRPIMEMVRVAQAFRDGDTNIRFDESRRDELGYVAKFVNGALDSLLDEQQTTKQALRQLGASQKALQDQHDLLELRVEERTKELQAANKELEAYSYSIAHDLRQPLRAIDGFSLLLLEDYENKLDEEGRSYLRRVRHAAQRMGHLIDDILELSRVARAEIRSAEVDLASEAQHILGRLHEDEPDREVKITVPKTLKAWGDPSLIRVTLENLLGNAWKYSAHSDASHIEFGVERLNGEPVYYVKDNGVGFDEKYREKLFRPFERLHNDPRFEGTGIGLATVARAIHKMGGEVWANSAPGEGATFYFKLGRC